MKKKKFLIEEDRCVKMARYKLGIFSKKEGRVIDLDSIVKLKNLESLDKFTIEFEDESQFKTYLFNQGLITKEELNKNLNILYKYNKKVKKIKVFYRDMKKYLDFEYLEHKLKSLSRNIEFLEKLANFYHNGSTRFNKQGTNVNDIRIYLSDVRSNGGEAFQSKKLEIAIEDLFQKAAFTLLDKETGEVKYDYRGLRDLALFVYKFVKSQEKELEKIENVTKFPNKNTEDSLLQSSLFDVINEEKKVDGKWILSSEGEPEFPPNSEEEANYLKYLENLEKKQNYTKKRTKKIKPEDIWVQSSLFDAINEEKKFDGKWILSSEGEPEFPPNSEEEANYLRYLEKLEEMSNQSLEDHDHYRRR